MIQECTLNLLKFEVWTNYGDPPYKLFNNNDKLYCRYRDKIHKIIMLLLLSTTILLFFSVFTAASYLQNVFNMVLTGLDHGLGLLRGSRRYVGESPGCLELERRAVEGERQRIKAKCDTLRSGRSGSVIPQRLK